MFCFKVDDLVTQVDDEFKIDSQIGPSGSRTMSTGVEDLEERARALKYGTSELIGNILTV